MSRKSSSKGTGAKLRRAAAGAVRRKAGGEVRKNARKVFRKIPLKILIPAAAAVFGILAGVTFVPEERVPRALEKPHTALLTARNKLIRMSGLPISRTTMNLLCMRLDLRSETMGIPARDSRHRAGFFR